MRVIEQEWTLHPVTGVITSSDGRRIIARTDADSTSEEEQAIAATPDMVRMLTRVARVFGGSSIAAECEGVLRKAGMLP